MATETGQGQVAVFGGTGFLGTAIVERLTAAKRPVRMVARRAADDDRRAAQADVRDPEAVARALEGCSAAVNCVGLYLEQGSETFESVHVQGARVLAEACAAQGIERLVQLSGIGADAASPSRYVRARAEGEAAVRGALPSATILRPSAVFDPEDRFINALAEIVRTAPVIPLFGRGETLLQPVFRGDVAEAVQAALQDTAARGETYELGGPQAYRYRALLELVMTHVGKRRPLLPMPFAVWDAMAAGAALLPKPPLTDAQVTLMKQDNVVASDARVLQDLGIAPTALEEILPRYAL